MPVLVAPHKIEVRDLRVKAGGNDILKGVSLDVRAKEILALIGPAGSGKTTLLRVLNRLTDLETGLEIRGRIMMDGLDILDPAHDVTGLRRRISMVFAEPTPLPMSIRENLLLGLKFKRTGPPPPAEADALIEKCLRAAFLWDEVKDRLSLSGLRLSGGQQQRLCLARSLMLSPEVLLLDEPCSGLDPISTAKIEEALQELKKEMAVVLVTNNVKQASRTSDRTAFLLLGELIETGATDTLFTNPADQRTSDYVSGRFG
jgi:phosphate transport system ATP-binding protein